MQKNTKIQAFEYVLFKLTQWYINDNQLVDFSNFNNKNDLSKLKVIKLHFFVSAVNSNSNDLLSTFDKFYAMPYGHVESDVYTVLSSLMHFIIDTKKLTIKDVNELSEKSFEGLPVIIRHDIDNSINSLKKINSKIINYNALDLVDISHRWFSWSSMMNYAKQNNRNSEFIPPRLIQQEDKIFELGY